MLSREKQAKSQFLRAAGLPLEKLQKELKGVGSTPIRSSISTLSSNSNYSSVIGVGGTLQFHPKELEWSPNLHIHSWSGPVSDLGWKKQVKMPPNLFLTKEWRMPR